MCAITSTQSPCSINRILKSHRLQCNCAHQIPNKLCMRMRELLRVRSCSTDLEVLQLRRIGSGPELNPLVDAVACQHQRPDRRPLHSFKDLGDKARHAGLKREQTTRSCSTGARPRSFCRRTKSRSFKRHVSSVSAFRTIPALSLLLFSQPTLSNLDTKRSTPSVQKN